MSEKRRNVNPLKSVRMVGKLVDSYYEELMKSHENGKKVAWYVGYPFPQLLQAMDVNFLVTEQYGARHAARHEEGPLLATANAWEINQEICTYLRASLACALYKLGKVTPPPDAPRTATDMDVPDFVLCTAPVCNQEPEWYDITREWYGVPGYMIEAPHCWDESTVEYSVNYIVEELKDMVAFIEKACGRPMDWERVRELMVETKKASTARAELLALTRVVPSPVSFWDLAISIACVYFLAGRPEATECLLAMKDEAEDRIKRGEGCIMGEEKYRLFFGAIACWPIFGRLADSYAAHGAAVVCGDYTHLTWYEDPAFIDPDKPLETFARLVAMCSLNRNLPWRIEAYSRLVRECSCDGMVLHGVRTCRPWAGQHLDILDSVTRRLGITGIYVDGDNANPQFVSAAQFETRLQALLETIEAQRGMGKERLKPTGEHVSTLSIFPELMHT